MTTAANNTASAPGPSSLLPAYGVGMVAMVLWAGSPAATRFMVADIDPLAAALMRIALAAGLALPLALILKLPLPRDWRQWRLLAISVGIGFSAFTVIYTYGISRTSTAHAALILAALPVFVGTIGAVLERRWPGPAWYLGAAVALAGEWLLITTPESSGEASVSGDLICLLAAACASAGYVAGSRLSGHIGTWSATFWALAIAGLIQVPVLIYAVADVAWAGVGMASWGGLLYMSFGVGIIGYAAWYWSLKEGGVTRMAPLQFTQPLISMVLAVVLFSEAITPSMTIAAVLILVGIAITRRG